MVAFPLRRSTPRRSYWLPVRKAAAESIHGGVAPEESLARLARGERAASGTDRLMLFLLGLLEVFGQNALYAASAGPMAITPQTRPQSAVDYGIAQAYSVRTPKIREALMRNCKMMLIGRDRHLEFFCERCAVGEAVETSYVRGRASTTYKVKRPGVCVSCEGSGCAESGRRCVECGGTGVCPDCNGSYAQSWDQLPITAQSKVLSRLEVGEDLLGGYEVVNGMFRTF